MGHILVFEHSDLCRPGRLGKVLCAHGFVLDIRRPDRDGPAAIPDDLREVLGVVSLGGPQSANDSDEWILAELGLLARAHDAGLPMLGVCLGHQFIAKALGGAVTPVADKPEAGFWEVSLNHAGQNDPVYAGMPWQSMQLCAHEDEVSELPPGAAVLGSSKACKNQAMRIGQRTYSFQYHFEWTDVMAWKIADDDPEFFARAGLTTQDIDSQMGEHYERFAQLSDRLCENLMELFEAYR